MAIGKEHPPAGLIVHTDCGVQYACKNYRTLLEQYGFKMSMSRKGNCYDNAFMESFFRSLKVELIHRHTFNSIGEARAQYFTILRLGIIGNEDILH